MKPSAFRIERLLARVEAEVARRHAAIVLGGTGAGTMAGKPAARTADAPVRRSS